jgi:N-acetylglucosaminyldiphosphoundecaprenol N-acetyl-beta-D-mannosaminyltransferase
MYPNQLGTTEVRHDERVKLTDAEISALKPRKVDVIGSYVTALPYQDVINLILLWAKRGESRMVCVGNTHMLIEAHLKPDFKNLLNAADLVTPDGMPLVWMLRAAGIRDQDRVAGMDILVGLCELAVAEKISVYFLGSQASILERMKDRLEREFPSLQIAAMNPLPFRTLTPEEDAALIQEINQSGAAIVLISLGCPKQEYWMAEHQHKIKAVMIGVGGVFPVYAGIQKRAPRVFREAGFEWLYRLVQEPRRLWKRYSSTVPLFMWLAMKQSILSLGSNALQHPTRQSPED